VCGFATSWVSVPFASGPANAVPDSTGSEHIDHSMDKAPLVTIIVPCYNGAGFLEEALRSALAQSYRKVEVIVIDDGSTDSSPEIAQRLPVRYIRQENLGLSVARNAGIRESKGSYVAFLDADDRLLPEAIESGLHALETHPDCAIAVGDHVFIAADGSHLGSSDKAGEVRRHYEALLKSNFIEMISSVLFRRSVFDEVGGFDTALRVAEDYDLYLRIARVRPICCHAAIIPEYRMHEKNTSLNSELMLTTTLRVLNRQAKYVRYDAHRLLAFCDGIRSWRKQYGRQLASEMARSYSAIRPDHLRRKLQILAYRYPQGLFLLLLRILPAFAQRNAASASRGQGQGGAGRRVDPLRNRRTGGALVKARLDFDSKGGGTG
jgi:glycosyltransferase involved in cell wall biosynthesis